MQIVKALHERLRYQLWEEKNQSPLCEGFIFCKDQFSVQEREGLAEGELWDQEFSAREEQAKAERTKLMPHLLVASKENNLITLKLRTGMECCYLAAVRLKGSKSGHTQITIIIPVIAEKYCIGGYGFVYTSASPF